MKRLNWLGLFAVLGAALSCSSNPRPAADQPVPSYSMLKIEELKTLFKSSASHALEAIGAILGEDPSVRPANGPSDLELKLSPPTLRLRSRRNTRRPSPPRIIRPPWRAWIPSRP